MKQKQGTATYRTRVNCGRVSGTVSHWQGEEGWIRPDSVIDHNLRSKNSGLLLVRQKDVSAGQALEPGQAVDFLVYAEVSEGGRLGAEFCRPVPGKSQPAKAQPQSPQAPQGPQKVMQLHLKKAQEKPTLMTPVPKKGGKPPTPATGKGMAAGKGKKAEGKQAEGKQAAVTVTPPGKGAAQPFGKGFKSNPPTTSTPSTPSEGFKSKAKLPRQQISTTEQTGELQVWFGKYGWIIPDTPVNHTQGGKHQGKIYIHLSDMEDDSVTVNPGCRVSFMVYARA